MNSIISAIKPSETLAITAKAKQLRNQGRDVLIFAAGEPDFDTPENIKQAAIEAIRKGLTKYTPASGIPELKEAICRKFHRENAIDYGLENIIISNGGKHCLSNIFRTLLEPGDEVILPLPNWVSYEEQIKIAGGTPYTIRLPSDFKLTAEIVENALTKKTKALVLNSPSNPTGAVVEPEEIKKIAKLAVNRNFYIVSDEVYEHFIYGGKKHLSIASLGSDIREKTITVNAVSKTYSMTGWRIGYVGGPKEIIKAMGNLQSQETSNPCSIAQYAALEALDGPQDSVKIMLKEFSARRKVTIDSLNSIRGFECYRSEGAFYAWCDISRSGKAKDSVDFANKLLDTVGVAIIPGTAFGGEGYIRMSYASSMDDIISGLKRIKEFVEH